MPRGWTAIMAPPGSPDAVRAGCVCTDHMNFAGLGHAEHLGDARRFFIVNGACPLHGRPSWERDNAARDR